MPTRAAPAAAGRAGRIAAYVLRLGLLEDPGAGLGGGLLVAPAAWVDRLVDSKLLADADHAQPERTRGWSVGLEAGPAAPPQRARDAAAGCAARAEARRCARGRIRKDFRFARRRAACSAGSIPVATSNAAEAMLDQGWLDARRAVPCHVPAVDHADAHQLRHHRTPPLRGAAWRTCHICPLTRIRELRVTFGSMPRRPTLHV